MSTKPASLIVTDAPSDAPAEDDLVTALEESMTRFESHQRVAGARYVGEVCEMRERVAQLIQLAYDNLTDHQVAQLAAHPRRPGVVEHLRLLGADFLELHGDRLSGDDSGLITGFARIAEHRVLVIGDYGSGPSSESRPLPDGALLPTGYRKVPQKIRLAQKFNLPVVYLIAPPMGHSTALTMRHHIPMLTAMRLRELGRLTVPIVSVLLGCCRPLDLFSLGMEDRIAAMNYACCCGDAQPHVSLTAAAPVPAPNTAHTSILRASELLSLSWVDDVVDEPVGGAHRDPGRAATLMGSYLDRTLSMLKGVCPKALLQQRRDRIDRRVTASATFIQAFSAEKVGTDRWSGTWDRHHVQ